MPEISRNKKAFFDYEILEKFEAGLVLKGFEVKAIKSGRINLAGSHIVIREGEAWLINADVPPYQPKNTPENYQSSRNRKLLLRKSEIKRLAGRTEEKGLTLVPLRVYTKQGNVKLELGLAKGKKQADKRQIIGKREANRRIQRAFRGKL